MNIQHSSRSDSWRTPSEIICLAREVLGGIDLDPASDAGANEFVMADCYYDETMDALRIPEWLAGSVFLNPPGGKIGTQSKVALFWKKLMEHRDSGQLTHAIFLAFSIEALQTTQNKECKPIGEFPFCVPSKRIKFVQPDGSIPKAPAHANMIVYVPGTIDATDHFYKAFKSLGNVLNTKRHP